MDCSCFWGAAGAKKIIPPSVSFQRLALVAAAGLKSWLRTAGGWLPSSSSARAGLLLLVLQPCKPACLCCLSAPQATHGCWMTWGGGGRQREGGQGRQWLQTPPPPLPGSAAALAWREPVLERAGMRKCCCCHLCQEKGEPSQGQRLPYLDAKVSFLLLCTCCNNPVKFLLPVSLKKCLKNLTPPAIKGLILPHPKISIDSYPFSTLNIPEPNKISLDQVCKKIGF